MAGSKLPKARVTCRYVVDDQGDVVLTGTSCDVGLDVEREDDVKRAEVRFPTPPNPDSMDWASAYQHPEEVLSPVSVEGSQIYENPRFQRVSYLADYPDAPQAEALMRRLALTVRPVMAENKWFVCHFTEFYPKQVDLLGLNRDHGNIILVRLRTLKDVNKFAPFEKILNSLLHELVHLWHDEHDGDFAALWIALNSRFGAAQRNAFSLRRKTTRPIDVPKGHISIYFGGTRIFLREDVYRAHFSIWAQKHDMEDARILASGYQLCKPRILHINISSQDPDCCLYARHIQIARGLDAACDKQIFDVPNSGDFWLTEYNENAFGEFHGGSDKQSSWGVELCLEMFRVGLECGMHMSTKTYLIQTVGTIFQKWVPPIDPKDWRWLCWEDYELDRDEPQQTEEPWKDPKHRRKASSTLGDMMYGVYQRTTISEGQPLRDFVVRLVRTLKARHKIAQENYDLKILERFINDIPDLLRDLQSANDESHPPLQPLKEKI